MGAGIKIIEVKSKSSLVKSKLCDFAINPYLGCGHGCRYCYASMIMQRWHHQGEEWGSFVEVRVNTPENVEREIRGKEGMSIYISSMTDAYQPVEEKYMLTRRTLEVLLNHEKRLFGKQLSITIQTKSDLVLRDLDILRQFKDIEVGITVTTLEDEVSATFEPLAPPPMRRIEALKQLNENKVKTYAFFGPVIPGVADSLEKIVEILRAVEKTATRKVYVDVLNYFPYLPRLKSIARKMEAYEMFAKTASPDYIASLKEKIELAAGMFNKLEFKIVF